MVRMARRPFRARCTVRYICVHVTDPRTPRPRTCAFAAVAVNIKIISRMICPANNPPVAYKGKNCNNCRIIAVVLR